VTVFSLIEAPEFGSWRSGAALAAADAGALELAAGHVVGEDVAQRTRRVGEEYEASLSTASSTSGGPGGVTRLNSVDRAR
jgi:hypothetical protein